MGQSDVALRVRISDLIRYYLRLGALGFGGPAALVGQVEQDMVQQRRWVSKEEFRESVAVCRSPPGSLAIQAGIFISYLREHRYLVPFSAHSDHSQLTQMG